MELRGEEREGRENVTAQIFFTLGRAGHRCHVELKMSNSDEFS